MQVSPVRMAALQLLQRVIKRRKNFTRKGKVGKWWGKG